MTKRVNKYKDTLDFLTKCDHNTAKAVIKAAKPDFICCVSDICFNILNGRVPLKASEKETLAKYKNYIRKIADKRETQKTKRQLIQKGGFLGALLKPLIGSVIAPVAKSLLMQ